MNYKGRFLHLNYKGCSNGFEVVYFGGDIGTICSTFSSIGLIHPEKTLNCS
jgi:hypothetical protein